MTLKSAPLIARRLSKRRAVPMLLTPHSNVFAAVATSVRAVNANFFPLLLWAVIVTVLPLHLAAASPGR